MKQIFKEQLEELNKLLDEMCDGMHLPGQVAIERMVMMNSVEFSKDEKNSLAGRGLTPCEGSFSYERDEDGGFTVTAFSLCFAKVYCFASADRDADKMFLMVRETFDEIIADIFVHLEDQI